MKKLITVFLITAMFLSLMVGCGKRSEEEEALVSLMSELQYACNNLDIDQFLECIDPDISDPIRLGMAFIGSQSGKSKEELFEDVISEMGSDPDIQENPSEFFSTLQIEVKGVEVDGDQALVTTQCSCTMLNEDFSREVYFQCQNEDGRWYVEDYEFK